MRRTTTIDMTWPDGPRGHLRQEGHARDLVTLHHPDESIVAATEHTSLVVGPDRTIADTSLGASALIGVGAVSGLRKHLAACAEPAVAPGRLGFQLLDDVPGATIVSDFALRVWSVYLEATPDGRPRSPRPMLGLCRAFVPGSSALNPDGSSTGFHHVSSVPPLPRPDDPLGWHDFDEPAGLAMRRARRIDVRVEDGRPAGNRDSGRVLVHAMFQDSATAPGGGRVAVHEYDIHVEAQRADGTIRMLDAAPGNLPYDVCPLAAGNVERLVGARLADLRSAVPVQLKGTAGCTHLNDALRALADVPLLARTLQEARAGQ